MTITPFPASGAHLPVPSDHDGEEFVGEAHAATSYWPIVASSDPVKK